jgi:hypothetical protein
MRRTIVDLQRKTNRKDTVIAGSLKHLIVRGLIQMDAGDGTQLERYSIPKGQAEELQNRW